MFTRRKFMESTAATLVLLNLPFVARGSHHELAEKLKQTNLIYVTPIRTDGKESRCQAEIWFAADGTDMYVCTGTGSWRARAPRKGLSKARVWIGDLGNWRSTGGRYRKLPSVEARVAIIEDRAEQDRVLALFGDKYTAEWGSWGPRFRNGLDDGSRTMLRYRPES
ncbi:MAG: hypothetical protein WD002_13875 [Pseudomonadales bacterium]